MFELLWGIGAAFVQVATVLAGYLHYLKASNTMIGLLPAATTTCLYIASTLSLHLIRPEAGRLRKVLRVYYVSNLGYIALGILTVGLPLGAIHWRILSCFVCQVFFSFLVHTGDPHYSSMVVEITDPHERGRFFGMRMVLTGCGGVLGGGLCAALLKWLPSPMDYGICFSLGGLLILGAVGWFSQFREIGLPEKSEQGSYRELLASGFTLVRNNRSFAMFLCWLLLFLFAQGIFPFLAVHSVERLRLPDSVMGQLTVAFTLSTVVMSMAFGWLGDHYGHRSAMRLALLLFLIGITVTGLAPSLSLVLIGYFLTSCWLPAIAVTVHNYALRLLPETQPAKVMAAVMCVSALFRTISYVGTGIVLDHTSFEHVMGSSLTLTLAAMFLTGRLKNDAPGAIAHPHLSPEHDGSL